MLQGSLIAAIANFVVLSVMARRLPFQTTSKLYKTIDSRHYFTHIRIGAHEGKQQLFSVLVLTDTSDIIIPCDGCSDCDSSASPRRKFSKRLSASVNDTSPNVKKRGASGPQLMDKICLGEHCSPSESAYVNFMCATKFNKFLKGVAVDGIVGIGSGDGKFNLIQKLDDGAKLIAHQINICLPSRGRTGTLTIGGYEQMYDYESIRWTRLYMVDASHLFKVKCRSVGIQGGDKAVHFHQEPGFKLDDPFTRLPHQVFFDLHVVFQEYCDKGKNCRYTRKIGPDDGSIPGSVACYKKLTAEQKKTFPTFIFQLEADDANFLVLPENYFFDASLHPDAPNKTRGFMDCIGIIKSDQYWFGANFMVNHNIIMDQERSLMGVASSACAEDLRVGDKGEDEGAPTKPIAQNDISNPRSKIPEKSGDELTVSLVVVLILFVALPCFFYWRNRKQCRSKMYANLDENNSGSVELSSIAPGNEYKDEPCEEGSEGEEVVGPAQ